MRHHLRRARQRTAFTIVELMIVMAIIALLMALVTAATFKAIDGQRRSNTNTEIQKVYTILKSQMEAVRKSAMDPNVERSQDIPTWSTFKTMAGGPSLDPNEKRARLIYAKFRLMEEFPMSFAEIVCLRNTPLNHDSPYLVKVNQQLQSQNLSLATIVQQQLVNKTVNVPLLGVSNPPPAAPEESAICLALALSRQRGGSDVKLSDLVSTLPKSTMYPSLDMLVDGYGNPLYFYRWASSDNMPDYLNGLSGQPAAGANDPMDPEGLLSAPLWVSAQANLSVLQQYGTWLHPVAAGQSYKLVPVIASNGRDGIAQVQGLAVCSQIQGVTIATPNGMKILPGSDDIFSYQQ